MCLQELAGFIEKMQTQQKLSSQPFKYGISNIPPGGPWFEVVVNNCAHTLPVICRQFLPRDFALPWSSINNNITRGSWI